MTALTVSIWNGRVHVAVDHGPPKLNAERVGRELSPRIAIHPEEADLPLSRLKARYHRAITEVLEGRLP